MGLDRYGLDSSGVPGHREDPFFLDLRRDRPLADRPYYTRPRVRRTDWKLGHV